MTVNLDSDDSDAEANPNDLIRESEPTPPIWALLDDFQRRRMLWPETRRQLLSLAWERDRLIGEGVEFIGRMGKPDKRVRGRAITVAKAGKAKSGAKSKSKPAKGKERGKDKLAIKPARPVLEVREDSSDIIRSHTNYGATA